MRVLLTETGCEMTFGATRCLPELADGLKKRGIYVAAVLPKHGNLEDELKEKGIPYYIVRRFHAWTYPLDVEKTAVKKVKWIGKVLLNTVPVLRHAIIIKKERIDLVHLNVMTDYVSAVAAILTKCDFVWHIREHLREGLGVDFFNRKFSERIIKKAKCLIAISESVASKWRIPGIPPVKVVYDAVSVQNYYIPADEKKIDKGCMHILMYGRIFPQKGQFLLVKALEKVFRQERNCNIKVTLAGFIEDREYYNEIMKFVEEKGLQDYVSYVGEILDVTALRELMKTVEAVAVCSYMEGFGRVTAEAMLSCSLVIGSDSGATAELVEDGETGLLYQNGDIDSLAEKIGYAVTHREECGRIAVNGQKYAEGHFSVERNVREVMEVYNNLKEQNEWSR